MIQYVVEALICNPEAARNGRNFTYRKVADSAPVRNFLYRIVRKVSLSRSKVKYIMQNNTFLNETNLLM